MYVMAHAAHSRSAQMGFIVREHRDVLVLRVLSRHGIGYVWAPLDHSPWEYPCDDGDNLARAGGTVPTF